MDTRANHEIFGMNNTQWYLPLMAGATCTYITQNKPRTPSEDEEGLINWCAHAADQDKAVRAISCFKENADETISRIRIAAN